MRLMKWDSLIIQEFFDDDLPDFYILSDTWGDDEITFQDVYNANATEFGEEQ
jgi:hypothetical protein